MTKVEAEKVEQVEEVERDEDEESDVSSDDDMPELEGGELAFSSLLCLRCGGWRASSTRPLLIHS